ncbi:MAG: hypothetical protein JSS49_14500 [Planctomycetes bacterium]|nr:hypothetical protein [Planctomycetota bacterium]
MKTFQLGLVLLALAVISGCTENTVGGPGVSSPPPGNSTSTTAKRPDYGQPEETFTLLVPLLSTQMKQGETKEASVGVSRGKNFDEDVTLKFDELPAGVTITPASTVIKHGDSETKIAIRAMDDAALGDFTIKVVGHPTMGADATSMFKLTVKEK